VAAVSYDPVLQPFTVCDGAILEERRFIGNVTPWSNGIYLNTGDEPLLFEFTVTDPLGNSTTATSGPWDPGVGPGERLFTTVTSLDTLKWELDRTVTMVVTGTVSGEEVTETHQLTCPLVPAAFPFVNLTCGDVAGPYRVGDVYRFPVEINNSLEASSVAITAFSLTTEDGTLEPAPPDALDQGEVVPIELLHTLTEDERDDTGNFDVVIEATTTFTWAPPAGSAAEGVAGTVNETFLPGVNCFIAGAAGATATPTETPTDPEPTATPTSEPDSTSTPIATTPPDDDPTPRPTLRPTEAPSHDEEAPTPGTSKLPSAGTGGAITGDGQPVGLVLLVLTAFVLLGIARIRRFGPR
jgi:hypothetical protein